MKVSFQDYYGQNVLVHNETASGNVRMRVRTCKDMNQVRIKKEEDLDIETDISLNENQLRILIGALQQALDE